MASVIVIEDINEQSEQEWGISFAGSNPDPKDFFEMPNKETAFRLKGYLDIILKWQLA